MHRQEYTLLMNTSTAIKGNLGKNQNFSETDQSLFLEKQPQCIYRLATAVDIIDQLSTTFKICLCKMVIEIFLDYPFQLY